MIIRNINIMLGIKFSSIIFYLKGGVLSGTNDN
nr:MAG TPA: hypothetical protein [Caudoviricetes sp.]